MADTASSVYERDATLLTRAAVAAQWSAVLLVVLMAGWLLRRLERSSRQTALAEAEQRALHEVDMLVRHAADLVACLDRDGVAQFLSPAVETILGQSPQALLGQSIWSHVPSGDRERVRRYHEQLLEQPGKRLVLETDFLHKSGSKRILELRATNLLDDPEVGAIILNARDITARKRLEGQLEQQALHDALTGLPNRRLFADRLEHALSRSHRHRQPVAVMFLDLDRFKLVNDSLGTRPVTAC